MSGVQIISICVVILLNVNVTFQLTDDLNSKLEECVRLMQENQIPIERQPSVKQKCETHGCVKAAAQIVSSIDENVDPCEDFNQFANGRFIKDTTDETEDDESRSLYDTVTESVNKKVVSLLSEPIKDNEWKPYRLAKTFYSSCLSQSVIVKRGNQGLIEFLDSVGGWPVIKGKSWLSRKFSLTELIRNVKDFGFDTDVIFAINVGFDATNTTNRLLEITYGNYAIDKIDNDESVKIYRRRMLQKTAIFTKKGDEKARARINKEMEKVLSFEKQLIKIAFYSDSDDDTDEDDDEETDESDNDTNSSSEEEVRESSGESTTEEGTEDEEGGSGDTDEDGSGDTDEDGSGDTDEDGSGDIDEDDDDDVTYSTISQLQESYPYLNWLEYFKAVLPDEFDVTEDEVVMNSDAQFFKDLGEVMKTTSKRTLANYIIWRSIYKLYEMQTFEGGKARQSACINLTSKKFPIPVGLLYSRKYFNEKSKKAVSSLVEDVRFAFIDMLANVTWMDNVTRVSATEKAQNIVTHIGYPNELFGKNGLDQYYEDLEMEEDEFIRNSLSWNIFDKHQRYNSLMTPMNRSGWEELLDLDPSEANAFYVQSRNSMQFPIAILHELFFSVDRPQYINYASLGNTVGHEIVHGFDDSGRKFDSNGNLKNWWNGRTKQRFAHKTKCFVDQYSHYTDSKSNLTLDGEYTLDENIADNGGTRAAYYAYQNFIKRNGPEQLVPGVKYNQNQLFWIAYAQAESSVNGVASLIDLIENDVHAPDEFRINGVVSNMREFARDFNCSVGSKMNPAKKCKLW